MSPGQGNGRRGNDGIAAAWRLARRELRGGLGGFRIFLACLTLCVAAIAGVGSLSQAVEGGLRNDARRLLGGDVSIRRVQRPAEHLRIGHVADRHKDPVAGKFPRLARLRILQKHPAHRQLAIGAAAKAR